jgi:hypothetical protein
VKGTVNVIYDFDEHGHRQTLPLVPRGIIIIKKYFTLGRFALNVVVDSITYYVGLYMYITK